MKTKKKRYQHIKYGINTIFLLPINFFILQKVNEIQHQMHFDQQELFSNNSTFKELIALNKEYIEIKEQDTISAQDQYENGTKLNRKLMVEQKRPKVTPRNCKTFWELQS